MRATLGFGILLSLFGVCSSALAADYLNQPERYTCAAIQRAIVLSGTRGLQVRTGSFLGLATYRTFYSSQYYCDRHKDVLLMEVASKDGDCVPGYTCSISNSDDELYGH